MAPYFDHLFAALSPFNSRPFPFKVRLIALFLQPLNLLTYLAKSVPWLLSPLYQTLAYPCRDGYRNRFIVFPASGAPRRRNQRYPLHIDIHGGAFIGGRAEYDIEFMDELRKTLSAPTVVVGLEYRCAPRWRFPTAHNDVFDAVKWLLSPESGFVERYNVDLNCVTLSGFSAGGGLAYSLAVRYRELGVRIHGIATFYAVLDLATRREEKKYLDEVEPPSDPMAWVGPLMDTYLEDVDVEYLKRPEYSPLYAGLEHLPRDMLLVVPTVCPLAREQLVFAERIKRDGRGRLGGMVVKVFKGCWHGWLEMPEFAIDRNTKVEAFNTATSFLKEVQRKNGF